MLDWPFAQICNSEFTLSILSLTKLRTLGVDDNQISYVPAEKKRAKAKICGSFVTYEAWLLPRNAMRHDYLSGLLCLGFRNATSWF